MSAIRSYAKTPEPSVTKQPLVWHMWWAAITLRSFTAEYGREEARRMISRDWSIPEAAQCFGTAFGR